MFTEGGCEGELCIVVFRFKKKKFLKANNELDTLQISLCQDDLTLLMNILLENLGEPTSRPIVTQPTLPETQMVKKGKVQTSADHHQGISAFSLQIRLI